MLGGWWLSLRPSSDLSASALFVREQIECTGRAWRQTRHIQRVLKINMLRKIYSIYWNLIKEIWWTSGIVVHIIVVHTYSFMSFILRDASFYSHELIWPLYTLLVQIFELVSWEMENHDLLTCWLAPQVKSPSSWTTSPACQSSRPGPGPGLHCSKFYSLHLKVERVRTSDSHPVSIPHESQAFQIKA